MSKNSNAGGRRRPPTLREVQAEFRGVHSADELEDMLDEWSDDEIVPEASKGDYRFPQD